jgi:WS/DGAT/MGAT family acyltransferase
MRILVSSASRHGSTAEAATRIAGSLRAGLPAEIVLDELPAAEVGDPASYDAVVLGSAVYMGRWLDDARQLAERIAAQPPRPVWLFSVGPIGDPPKPDEQPAEVGDIVRETRARGHRLFAGRLDRHRLGFGEKAVVMALHVKDGDFRDWGALDAWGSQIAVELSRASIGKGVMPPSIERTSPTDLMQLASDLPGAPMQVAAVLVLDPAPAVDLAAVREAISRRLPAVPRLRQCLVRAPFGAGRPVWVDDPDFDICTQVNAVDCPAPGDEAALLGIVADTMARSLPRNRPLWSATMVGSLSGGRAALVVTLHHVLADGIGGLAVLARLVDGAPATPDTVFPRPSPSRRALLLDALVTRGRALGQIPLHARQLRGAIAELTTGGVAGPPRSSMNQPIGAHRTLAVARADLASVQRVAHAHGATVNDVVLTAVTGALHAVLGHRGESVDRFVISVPVAARRTATAGHLGNEVGVMTVPVTVAGDVNQRLAAIARTTRNRRPVTPSMSVALLGPLFRTLAGLGLFRWFVDRQHLVTTMVTNLRGPDVRLSFLAAPITEVIPVSPITGNVTVAFAVLSYAGTLTITVIADPQRCPDLRLLLARLQSELDLVVRPAVTRKAAR